jgi:hypothetical protein
MLLFKYFNSYVNFKKIVNNRNLFNSCTSKLEIMLNINEKEFKKHGSLLTFHIFSMCIFHLSEGASELMS